MESADALHSEVEWLLGDECEAVFDRIRKLLKEFSISLQDAAQTREAPLRCGSSEDGSSERRQRAHEQHVLAEQEVDYDEPVWGSNPVPTPIIQHIDTRAPPCIHGPRDAKAATHAHH